jgi:hypothetical protein
VIDPDRRLPTCYTQPVYPEGMIPMYVDVGGTPKQSRDCNPGELKRDIALEERAARYHRSRARALKRLAADIKADLDELERRVAEDR